MFCIGGGVAGAVVPCWFCMLWPFMPPKPVNPAVAGEGGTYPIPTPVPPGWYGASPLAPKPELLRVPAEDDGAALGVLDVDP